MDYLKFGSKAPLFFMHIPKTAGSSVRLFLDSQYENRDVYPGVGWRDISRSDAKFINFPLVRGHFTLNLRGALDPNVRVLTILREPVARTISALLHMKRDPAFHWLHAVASNLTLKEIIRTPSIMNAQRNVQAAYLCASTPPTEVMAYMMASNRDLHADPADLEDKPTLELAIERLQQIDFLGTLDDLHRVMEDLTDEMNFHPAVYFPSINADPNGGDALRNLDPEDIDILRDCNSVDLPMYSRAKSTIQQRRFECWMRRLVGAGIYKAAQGSFEINLEGIIPGSGWYDVEREAGQVWRWTGPGRFFSIEVPLRADASYELEIGFVRPYLGSEPGLGVEVNGEEIPLRLQRSGSAFVGFVHIPINSLARSGGFCRLCFDTRTTLGADSAGGDMRVLGISVNRLRFHCE